MFDYNLEESLSSVESPKTPMNFDSIKDEVPSLSALEDALSYFVTSDSAKDALYRGHAYFLGEKDFRTDIFNYSSSSPVRDQFLN